MRLNERAWKYKISTYNSKNLRNALKADIENITEEELENIKSAIIAVFKNIHNLIPDYFEDYEVEDIIDELAFIDIEDDEEDIEDNINAILNNMYDIYDDYSIWIEAVYD